MTPPDRSAGGSPSAPTATGQPSGTAQAAPWAGTAAWALLDESQRAALGVLFGYVAAVRGVVDHPALSIERKEAALAAMTIPFKPKSETPMARSEFSGPGLAAYDLARLLSARGIDSRRAWQILQAAGQDLRKNRYPDWSDLLVWCRFAAAPAASLAFELVDATPEAIKRAESLGIALQLLDCVQRARTHYRWLGRVYLPERWFTEAGTDTEELGAAHTPPALRKVFARALDQAMVLLRDGARAPAGLSGFRLRWAGYTAIAEYRRLIRAQYKADLLARAPEIPPSARRLARIGGFLRALLPI